MAVNLSPVAGVAAQFFDNSGNVLTGGKIFTYSAGTTTPAVTYTTNAGDVAWSNPIILNAAGRVSGSGEVWVSSATPYKFVLKDANDVLIATYDNLYGVSTSGQAGYITAVQGQTACTVPFTYLVGSNSVNVYVNGCKQIVGLNYNESNPTTITFIDGLNVGDVVEFVQ